MCRHAPELAPLYSSIIELRRVCGLVETAFLVSLGQPTDRISYYARWPIFIESECASAAGMSALAWTRFHYLTRPARLLRLIIDDVAKFIENKRARWSPYATLERCADKLEHLRSLIRAISPQRRRKIETAADRGVCKHIVDVEAVLEGCVPLSFYLISPLCL